jgi:hypothetical protein
LADGDGFRLMRLAATLPPILWASIPFTRYKTPREHVVALVSAAAALAWVTLTWIANVQFLFQ